MAMIKLLLKTWSPEKYPLSCPQSMNRLKSTLRPTIPFSCKSDHINDQKTV